MRTSKVRVAACCLLALAPLVSASPASAAPELCTPLPASAPGTSDNTLCVDADASAHVADVQREQCGGLGSCMAYYVYFEPSVRAGAEIRLCYTDAGGAEECAVALVPVDDQPVGGQLVCIGWDLRGGFPCPDGGPVWIEP